ncbi:MAG TPA: hypothetical protein VL354_09110 [Spirochaetia bacterium]|nr:hypothetical protein [Spirochaetia bacterium]
MSVADTVLWWQGADGGTLQNDLSQAYVSVTATPDLTMVIGKQRLSWGTGYAFFPGDRINPPVSPQNRSEGFYGLTANLAPSSSFSLSASVRVDTVFADAAVLPGLASPTSPSAALTLPVLLSSLPAPLTPAWLGLRYALYAEAFLGTLDLHAGATWEWRRVLRPTFDFSLDFLGFIFDGAVAVELADSDLYPDASGRYSSPGFGKPFPIATVGIQRAESADNASLAVTLEYLYDSTGYDPAQESRFLNDLFLALTPGGPAQTATFLSSSGTGAWFSSGEVIPALGQHYGALTVSGSITNVLSASTDLAMNLQDLSLALQAELRFTRLEGIDLFSRVLWAGGPDNHTEFGSSPVQLAVSAGATVHF